VPQSGTSEENDRPLSARPMPALYELEISGSA
jgi:hypothetical protein